MRMRRTAVAALLAAGIVVPTVATAAAAFAQPATSSATASRAVADRATPKPSRTRKPVRTPFAATGRIAAVDVAAGTVTVLARGGTKDVRKRTVTVTVADTARVKVNSRRATLAAFIVGAKITVTGVRTADGYTANRVQVSQRRGPVVTPSPSPTVDPTPTVTPTMTPTDPTSDDEHDEHTEHTEDPEDENSDDLSD